MKLLLADDEEEMTRALSAILKFSGYEVDVVSDGPAALDLALKNSYDALVLDVMMPEMSGVEVVEELRRRNYDTPILMLTAKAELEDKVDGLNKGADDYLTKPFYKEELLARINALTRPRKFKQTRLEIGNVFLDMENNSLYTDKASFTLNHQESLLLEILAGNRDRKLDKQELLESIWGEDKDSEIVVIYISYLQNKLRALNANVEILEENGYYLADK